MGEDKKKEQEYRIWNLARQWGVVGVVGIVGVGILIYGVWRVIAPEEPRVEIVEGPTSPSASLGAGEVVVDVAGAVMKPGLYKLPSGSRVGDALVMAGGLAEQADREWVSRYINLAEEAKDGGKIYIPRQSENSENSVSQSVGVSDGQTAGVSDSVGGKININTASVAELDSLWGIGEARAKTIIDNRPYGTVEELLTKAKLPQNVYDTIRDEVTVY